MKAPFLALVLLSAACGRDPAPATKPTPTTAEKDAAAIRAYILKTANDPASYQPVSLGKPSFFSQADSLDIQILKGADADPAPASLAAKKKQVGRKYFHQYRERNEAGGLVLKYQHFAVYNNGTVEAFGF